MDKYIIIIKFQNSETSSLQLFINISDKIIENDV